METRTYPSNTKEVLTYNEDHQLIHHEGGEARKGNEDDALHLHPDRNGNRRVTIEPKSKRKDAKKHPILRQDFHPRSKAMTRQQYDAGRESDIIDNGAQLTTRKRYDKEGHSKEYYLK